MQTHLYFINNELEKQFIHYHDFIQKQIQKNFQYYLYQRNGIQKSDYHKSIISNHLDIKLLFILLMEK